ncbi:MAG: sulfatase-like hydrolase/transferase [Phycisphaerae bacterium]|nr:sulfatase-like hydrolase/transferase [Phycisphaerae bacterium]
MMHRWCHLAAILLLLFSSATPPAVAADQRPNILWLSAEDISPHLGCYGDPHAITPHLDRLAAEGVRFSHAFTTAGVCAPCRSGIITGMYQTSLGTHHMRCSATLPGQIQPFPLLLRQAGYYCTNSSKKDYQFKEPKGTWDESSGKAHWRKRKRKDQPFFAVFNFTGCHESGIAAESKYKSVTKDLTRAQRQDPAGLTTLPPYYPDTPVTREDWKRNYELITAMDAWAGNLIQQLKDDGLYDRTVIFFWSDHGVGLPRAKRWLYDSGTHVPLIVRAEPGLLRKIGAAGPSSVSDRLVSSIDFGPTALNLAGLDLPDHLQGRPFLGPDLPAPRDYVYGARDRMDERYDIIRMVRDHRYKYIRNYEPFKPYYQYMNTPEKGATMKEIRRVQAEGGLPPAAALFTAPGKPNEELYDLKTDPHEIRNLADDPAHAPHLGRLRRAHLDWVLETRDLGLIPEPEIELRERRFGNRYDILRRDDGKLMRRLRDAAGLALAGEDHLPDMLKALTDEDAAVRYWAAVAIGNLEISAELADNPMIRGIKDRSTVVRIACARALARQGLAGLALPVLQRELSSPEPWSRLHAAIVLDEMDEAARPAIPQLKAALRNQPNKYIVRVANRALNELLGTENVVR